METQLVTLVAAHSGTELTVPKEFFSYRALDEAEPVESTHGRNLIRFGVFGLNSSMYFNEASQEVLYGMSPQDVELVNTSLPRFTQCIVRLGEIFPFYGEESDVDEWEAGAQRVEDVIREVDLSAYREGAYWYEFRWDVSMGNFHE
ncbi:SUKH-4 family immunity protein [Streptomyces sp. NPDC018947]|uniref:SUKH-4 family immunity protein n=1 Tax=Streptomyces sp. NPDC018947 TaxID=3365054 RepID=UPI00379892D5